MLNKILGVVLIVIGVVLGLAFLVGIPGLISQMVDLISNSSAYNLGIVMGSFTASLVLGGIAFLLIRFGLKLYKKPPKTKNRTSS